MHGFVGKLYVVKIELSVWLMIKSDNLEMTTFQLLHLVHFPKLRLKLLHTK